VCVSSRKPFLHNVQDHQHTCSAFVPGVLLATPSLPNALRTHSPSKRTRAVQRMLTTLPPHGYPITPCHTTASTRIRVDMRVRMFVTRTSPAFLGFRTPI